VSAADAAPAVDRTAILPVTAGHPLVGWSQQSTNDRFEEKRKVAASGRLRKIIWLL
jgi:hypothetical protein